MNLDNSVDDGNLATFDLKDKYFSSLYRVILVVGEEQQVTSVECRFHTATGMGHGNKSLTIAFRHSAGANLK